MPNLCITCTKNNDSCPHFGTGKVGRRPAGLCGDYEQVYQAGGAADSDIWVHTPDERELDEVLEDRGGDYGDLGGQWAMAQSLKAIIISGEQWIDLDPIAREALEMICTKISRIVVGGDKKADNWLDIEGYAKLAREHLHDKS